MKPLSVLQSLVYSIGGILFVVGAALPLFIPFTIIVPIIYSVGIVLFASMQIMAKYTGSDQHIIRLRRQQLLGLLFLLISAVLMWTKYLWIQPFCADEWKIGLLIGTIFWVYSTLRISHLSGKAPKRMS